NHGELDKVSLSGQISRVVDVSATQGHVVPTAVVAHDGDFYITNLGTFPVHRGTQKVYRVTQTGQVSVAASGLTAAVGLAFDERAASDARPGWAEPRHPVGRHSGAVPGRVGRSGWHTLGPRARGPVGGALTCLGR